MQIALHRDGRISPGHPKPLWGFHSGKIWTAATDSSSRQSVRLGLTVYCMILTSREVYGNNGTFIPVGSRSYHLDVTDAVVADFEQHMVFDPEAAWAWLSIGAVTEGRLIPKADLFNVLPLAHQLAAHTQDWSITATVMCEAFCAAVARDEYARGM